MIQSLVFFCPYRCGNKYTPFFSACLYILLFTCPHAGLRLECLDVESEKLTLLKMLIIYRVNAITLKAKRTFIVIIAFLYFIKQRMINFLEFIMYILAFLSKKISTYLSQAQSLLG